VLLQDNKREAIIAKAQSRFVKSSVFNGEIMQSALFVAKTQIYDIRRFVFKDTYPDTLLIASVYLSCIES